jgi:hypothetical protein
MKYNDKYSDEALLEKITIGLTEGMRRPRAG